jgi:hypothetical protein
MVALEKNLILLVESIEDCLAKRRLMPCLILLYSAIDIVASLESGGASSSAFMAWCDKYLLQGTSPPCAASDLYGARCGVLHTLSAESSMSRAGKARPIFYAWGNKGTDELGQAATRLGRDVCIVHVDKLIRAFRLGLATYIQEVIEDDKRTQQLFAGAGAWLTDIDPNAVRDFLSSTQ